MWRPEELIAERKRQIKELEQAIEQREVGGETLEDLRARLAKLKRELAKLESSEPPRPM